MIQPLRIAVADDEPDMLDYLQRLLPRLGHQVVCAAQTGIALVDQCRAERPDLVITDIKMPDMDGIEAAVQICSSEPVPVILVSAHHDPELIERAGEGHILAYLIKPIKEDDLKPAIVLAMRRFEQFQALCNEADGLRQALQDRKVIEQAKGILMKKVGLDEQRGVRATPATRQQEESEADPDRACDRDGRRSACVAQETLTRRIAREVAKAAFARRALAL